MFDFIKKLFRRKENMNEFEKSEVEALVFAYLNSPKYKYVAPYDYGRRPHPPGFGQAEDPRPTLKY